MGPGKADLLEAIEREGSISAAARALGMSYRRAWVLVDVMNRCFADGLVAARPGGGAKAGASLTQDGRQALAHYRALEGAIAHDLQGDQDLAALEAAIRSVPLELPKG